MLAATSLIMPRNELEKRSGGVVTGPRGSNWIQIFVIELPGGLAEAAVKCQADGQQNLPVKPSVFWCGYVI